MGAGPLWTDSAEFADSGGQNWQLQPSEEDLRGEKHCELHASSALSGMQRAVEERHANRANPPLGQGLSV
jgi:hypothetical protein